MKNLCMLAVTVFLGACTQPTRVIQVTLHHRSFSVELSTDDKARERGLMMRTSLAPDHGMLFVFPHAGPQGFWMKNTLIPLDIAYFDEQRRLVSVQQKVPPCKADPCPLYPSAGPARYVLELAAGTAASMGLQIGDELDIAGDVGRVE